MKLTPEEIKQWNDAVSQLTAICNKHCTEEEQCKNCPFNSMRFGEYGEPEYCAIRAGVLYTGERKVTPSDYLRNLKEKRLRSREMLAIVKSCITCHWRNKETNFCPELGMHIMAPDTKLCDQWKPRVDLFEMEQKP